jgi:hypothetical protein
MEPPLGGNFIVSDTRSLNFIYTAMKFNVCINCSCLFYLQDINTGFFVLLGLLMVKS